MILDRVIPEPLLEFGGNETSYDIRHGISAYGPVDVNTPRAKSEIKIGVVGTPKTIAGFSTWMEQCSDGLKGKNSLNKNHNPDFPGLSKDVGFRAAFSTDPSWTSEISERELKKACEAKTAITDLVSIFHLRIESLYELTSSKPDCVICLPPKIVQNRVKPRFVKKTSIENESKDGDIDFHDYLKGLCLQSRSVFQLIWPRTYSTNTKEMQDPATRAWNLFGALFYKAGGSPWKLQNAPSSKRTCYVGISFSKRDDGGFMHSSLTQVFNDKGEGTILRGGVAHKSQFDHEVHLPKGAAKSLLSNAIANYRQANDGRKPDRVVVHKSSGYDAAETKGFNEALEDNSVEFADLVALTSSNIRLFRYGNYPLLRGTHVILDDHASILYTKGSVPYYRKYPGPYVPRSLLIRYYEHDRSPTEIATEILALTKLNWNKTQFDSFYPITLQGSKQIGTIYKWCPNPPNAPITYSFFM